MSDLQYTITKYDPVNKILDVTFADNGWANIHLKTPIPTSQTELEEVIMQMVPVCKIVEHEKRPVVIFKEGLLVQPPLFKSILLCVFVVYLGSWLRLKNPPVKSLGDIFSYSFCVLMELSQILRLLPRKSCQSIYSGPYPCVIAPP